MKITGEPVNLPRTLAINSSKEKLLKNQPTKHQLLPFKDRCRIPTRVHINFTQKRPKLFGWHEFLFKTTIQKQRNVALRRTDLGVISPTTTSDCAIPIVSKLKETDRIKIYGDFLTGINDADKICCVFGNQLKHV